MTRCPIPTRSTLPGLIGYMGNFFDCGAVPTAEVFTVQRFTRRLELIDNHVPVDCDVALEQFESGLDDDFLPRLVIRQKDIRSRFGYVVDFMLGQFVKLFEVVRLVRPPHELHSTNYSFQLRYYLRLNGNSFRLNEMPTHNHRCSWEGVLA